MTARWGAPAPDGIRHILRAPHHPARSVECPHCHAREHQPCTTISGRRRKTEPCPARLSAWAVTTACCPTCQVAPGTPCHHDGWPVDTHPARYTEAKEMAA